MRAWPYIAAIVSGFVLSLAYPRWNIETAVWLWALPLLGALWLPFSHPKVRPFTLGWLAGFSFFVINLSWLRHSSRVLAPAFAVDNTWAGWPQELMGMGAVLGLSLYCAVYFGIWASFTHRVARHRNATSLESIRSAALTASAWCGLEWLRGLLFSGFGWNGLGVAFHQNPLLLQITDSIGVTGLSFLPLFISGIAINAVSRLLSDLKNSQKPRPCYDLLAALSVMALTAAYGVIKLREPLGETLPLNTVLVQQNIPQAVKWQGEQDGQIYERLASLTQEQVAPKVGSPPVDLVIWPESALPFPLYTHPDHGTYFDQLLSLGEFSLLTGAEVQLPNEPMFTSAVLLRGSFQNQQHYHKVHLVPFGEYLPFRDVFPFSLLRGVLPGDFLPGPSTEPLTLEKPEVGIIPLICFEDTVGRLARKFVRPGPQVIVNVTNDGWFLRSAEPEIHTANAIFRAVELRRPMLRAANTGVTCVIDSKGHVTSRLVDPETGSHFIEGTLKAEVQIPKHPPLTLYARFGDAFSVTLGILAFLAAMIQRFKPSPKAAE